MMVNEQILFLLDVTRLIERAFESGFLATGGELWRPKEMQDLYMKQGKTKTLKSYHLDRLAIDLNFFKKIEERFVLVGDKKTLQPLGAYWESLDQKNRWGGNFKTILDCPHFERAI